MVTSVAPAPVRTERILLVEDDEFSSQLIVMYLEKSGFAQIAVARDGREALELARNTPFDLILLDLNLPRLNGPEVLRRLKKDDALERTSVLVISSLTNTEATANCMEHGAEDYLPKPFNKQLLESRVLSILDRRRMQADLAAASSREAQAIVTARHLQAATIDSMLAGYAGKAARVLVPGDAFTGTLFDIRPLGDGTFAVLAAEAATPGIAGGLAAMSLRARLDLLLRESGAADHASRPAALLERVADAMAPESEAAGGVHLSLTIVDPASGTLRRAGSGFPSPLLVRRDGSVEAVRAGGPGPTAFAPGDMLAVAGMGVTQRESLDGAPPFNLKSRLAGQTAASPADLAFVLSAALSPAPAVQAADLALLLLTLPAA